ncbi:hypothetical protein [uncultured Lacticaseibacillus sp.]|uniref:hypothetical protein n=1 Tax=uncultured Lacticaseibacillus sp. TaxID=2775882 RepID=UPI002596786B|nr:hypothetical protein [uncultured Lacticaseibacillus sp.]
MKHQLAYQSAPVDCIIFWGLIVSGFGLTTVVQLELLGVSPITVTIGLITFAFAVVQLLRYRIVVTPTSFKLGRMMPGNSITLKPEEVTIQTRGTHTLTLITQRYGELTISTWRRASTVATQLQQWLNHNK